MNFPTGGAIALSAVLLAGCAKFQEWYRDQAYQILDWYLWENIQTWDMAYREWTPVPNADNACDMIQPIFDKTTWEPLAIIDPRYVKISENNWNELIILCDETNSATDAWFNLEEKDPIS
jgi:hypothetical protein